MAYYRVSTDQQGRSGLGLEAQKAAVAAFMASQPTARLAAEFEEVESGKRNDRPQLAAALAACRARRAVLVIAKIDRLARNARFLLSVVEGVGDAGVAFCDLPQIPPGPTGRFLLTLLAAVAELEAGLISQRTKAALAAAKARGVKLGGPRNCPGFDTTQTRNARAARTAIAAAYHVDVWPYIEAAQRAGATSLRQIAEALTARGVRPPSGGEVWHAKQVSRLLQQRKTA
ncbi:recombinase family protein [Muricoccus roseus]|nr:recombinase family protein [Roseomonas rosea]